MKKFLKVLLIILAVLLLAVLAVVLFINSKLDLIEYDDEIDKSVYQSTEPMETMDGEESLSEIDISDLVQAETLPEIPEGEIWEEDGVFNILILGTDERTKDFSENARSDAMILASIDKVNNTVKLVSLERGMGVPILEGRYEGNYDILTHIFRYGGADLVVRTVREVLRVDVDHYVRFNFTAVKEIVDLVGGINVELTEKEAVALNTTIEKNRTTDDQKDMVAGMNHMDGGTTLSFARLRFIDSDWHRIERQRRIIIATVDSLKDSSIRELNDLVDEALPMIQTNLSKLEIAELMFYAPKLLTASFDQMTIPQQGTYGGATGMNGQGMFAPDYELNSQILHDFLYGEE